VADKYTVAAHLEFWLRGRADVYVLDHPRNHLDGRALQLDVWGMGEQALRARAGEDALIVRETGSSGAPAATARLVRTALFDALEPLDDIEVAAAGKSRRFVLYAGRVRGDGAPVQRP
jgi:hypothetical protein